jgi:hypothetical protein
VVQQPAKSVHPVSTCVGHLAARAEPRRLCPPGTSPLYPSASQLNPTAACCCRCTEAEKHVGAGKHGLQGPPL